MTHAEDAGKDCPKCDGRGHRPDRYGDKKVCSRCDGVGRVCSCHNYPFWKCPARHTAESDDE